MFQALTVVSLTVQEKVPAGKTELHLTVHRGDGVPFRLRTDRGQPFLLEDFGDRSLEVVTAFFSPGKIICTRLRRIAPKWWADTDPEMRTDRAVASTRIVAPTLRSVRSRSVAPPEQRDEVGYNAGEHTAMRPVAAAQYRSVG